MGSGSSTSQGTVYTPSGLPFLLLKGISYGAVSGLLLAVVREEKFEEDQTVNGLCMHSTETTNLQSVSSATS